ncbi:MAG: PEP-CTERM sorting domain-containing protein [Colwellia sp.]|nr:PEP-CTERM sorting domain-containing protein [Colwellia sp.]
MKFRFLKTGLFGFILSLSCLTGIANAGFIPFGVQDDISMNTVINDWGWSLCYQGAYNASDSITNLFSNCDGEYVMLASSLGESDTLNVAAAALFTDVTTYTAHHATHLANGVEWYFNGGSMGFAPEGAGIFQSSADGAATGFAWAGALAPIDATTNLRLSWHTSGGYASTPTGINHGWRSGEYNYNNPGDNALLNASSRLVFTTNRIDVPEPSTLAIFALGIIGLASRRFKK